MFTAMVSTSADLTVAEKQLSRLLLTCLASIATLPQAPA